MTDDIKLLAAGTIIILIIIGLAIAVLCIIAMWKVFEKAGEEGWKCIIPIYNFIILLKIVGKPWWWLLLMCIPFVNIVIYIMAVHRLSLSFGKGAGFTLGLFFVGIVFIPILAFDNSTYNKLAD